MKKIFAIILSFIFIIILCAVITLDVYGSSSNFTGQPGSPNDSTLYNATNTFSYRGENEGSTSTYSYFNMNSPINNSVSENAPQITVLTHGLCGDASHWSNNSDGDFAYDSSSIISRLEYELSRNNGDGAYVYWAVMTSKTSFCLYDLNDSSNKNNSGKYLMTNSTNKIEDISKHIIIVFQATTSSSSGYNYEVYEEFNYMLSKIVYDVKLLNDGDLPKINLIGHSRGGLTNLEYALDHPAMIGSVFSLGTPYFGSDTASTSLGRSFANCDGVDDIINNTVYSSYYNRWNTNSTLYGNINIYAIGGYSDSDFVFDALIDGHDLLDDCPSITTLNIAKWGVKLLPGFVNSIANTADLTDFLLSMFRSVNYTQSEFESYVQIVADIKYTSWNSNSNLWNNILSFITHNIPVYGCPYFMNDLLVDFTSQTGVDEHSNTSRDYGFIKYQKLFTDYENTNKKLSRVDMPAVVHNLEARDDDLINYILSNIDLGVNDPYIYEILPNGSVKLTGYRGDVLFSSISLPSTVDNYTVVGIGSNFFHNDGSNITSITIPNSITTIAQEAFIGMDNLEEVTFGYSSNLLHIGDRAFAGCSSLSEFGYLQNYLITPSCLIDIGEYAFYGADFTYISLNSSLFEIGDFAFANIDSLSSITVSSNNDQYFSNNYVLYNYDGYLMQYPIAKSQTSYTIPSQVSGTYIVGVSNGAFMGAENLATIDLGYIEYIGDNAFEGCNGLTSISIPNAVNTINNSAFKNCTNLASITFSSSLSDIERSAFEGCTSLEEVEIPSSVTKIESDAFKGCSSLDLVSINKYQVPLTTLGFHVFNDCSSSLEIEVPDNRLAHYKNTAGWSSYRTRIVPKLDNYTTYYLNSTTDLNLSDVISSGCNKLYKLIVNTKSIYDFQASSNNTIKIELYNSSFVLIRSSSSSFSELLDNGSTYYLNIEYASQSSSGTIYTSIVRSNAHYHTYLYSWYNYTKHQKYCSCGDSSLEVHAVSEGSFGQGQQYATCLICGGPASMGLVGPMALNAYPYTVNGSFILPNGVVVLVDEDIDAYLDGTLVFINPGEYINRSNSIPYILKREDEYLLD